MQTLISLIVVLIAVIIGVNLANWCFREPNNIVYILIALYLYEVLAHLFSFSITLISFMGVRLGPSDILYLFMLVMVILNSIMKSRNQMAYSRINRRSVLYFLYFALQIVFLASFIRGLMSYGFNSDITTDIRRFYCFLIPVMYMLTFDVDFNNEKVIAVIDRFMTALLIFCYIMWGIIITTGLHLQVATNEGGTYLRIMGPETTFVVALYAIYSVYRDLRYRYALSIRTLMAVLAVILVQQRTVWVCSAVGLILMLIGMLITRNKDSETINSYNKGLTISSQLLLQLIFLSVILVVILQFGSGEGILGDLSNSYSSFSNLDEGTFGYRLALWSAHLSTLNGIERVIGKPFGAGYLVSSAEVVTRDITPHNGYVHTALRTGAIGVVLFVLMMVFLMVKGVSKKKIPALVVVGMVLVYFIGYTYTWYIGVAVGFCLKQVLEIDDESEYIEQYDY